jgi:hypothetical protein
VKLGAGGRGGAAGTGVGSGSWAVPVGYRGSGGHVSGEHPAAAPSPAATSAARNDQQQPRRPTSPVTPSKPVAHPAQQQQQPGGFAAPQPAGLPPTIVTQPVVQPHAVARPVIQGAAHAPSAESMSTVSNGHARGVGQPTGPQPHLISHPGDQQQPQAGVGAEGGGDAGGAAAAHPPAAATVGAVDPAAVAAAAAATNPLHMFAGLASRRLPVHLPRLPLPVDEATLLSNHINADHTRALPGYSVGKVIGEGGFCQVGR